MQDAIGSGLNRDEGPMHHRTSFNGRGAVWGAGERCQEQTSPLAYSG